MRKISRRKLLQAAGTTGALGTLGAHLPVGSAEAAEAGTGLERFDYLVVLMLENRSFDNMLGYLYGPGQVPRGQSFEGLAGKNLSNPIPPDADQARRRVVSVTPGTVMDHPSPDP